MVVSVVAVVAVVGGVAVVACVVGGAVVGGVGVVTNSKLSKLSNNVDGYAKQTTSATATLL